VIYTIINKSIERKLRRNDLPVEESAYANLDYIDPVTLQPVRQKEDEDEDEE